MKKVILFTLLLLPFSSYSQGQDGVAFYAKFPGGTEALDSFVNANLKLKRSAKKIAANKTIVLATLIMANEEMSHIKIRKSEADIKIIEEELLRVMQLAAETYKWELPLIRGKKTIFAQDIEFNFNEKCKVTSKMLPTYLSRKLVYDDVEEEIDPPATQTAPPPPPIVREEPKGNEVFYVVEKLPLFPGGQKSLDSLVYANFILPAEAREAGAEGKIFVEFIIDTTGTMVDIKVLKDGVGFGCGEETLRVIKVVTANYKWIPGEQRNKKVAVRYRYPITIKAEDYDPITGKNKKYHTN